MKDKTIQKVLDNKASTQEARDVASWFGQPESTPSLLQHLDDDLNEEWNRHHHSTRRHTIGWRIVMNVACTLLLIAGAWIGGYLAYHHRDLHGTASTEQLVCTARGERTQVVLQDGTRVYLNCESQLSYPTCFTADERRIHLEGEAYFEVTKNPHHPFIVEVGDATITVLGTKFNASSYRDEPIRVALDEGSIRFATPKHEQIGLQPSEEVTYNSLTGQRLLHNVHPNQTGAWRHNRIEVVDLPLADVMKLLERRYNVAVYIDNAQCYGHTYTFSMMDTDLRSVLDRMAKLSHLHFYYNASESTVHVK